MKENSLDAEIRRKRAESASRRPLADHDPFEPGEVAPGFGVNETNVKRQTGFRVCALVAGRTLSQVPDRISRPPSNPRGPRTAQAQRKAKP
jgi:hypothetical protein